MTPNIMRQLWSIVETTQSKMLVQMDDASLVQWLVKQTNNQLSLDNCDTQYLQDYIQLRLPLIRELAYERMV